MADKTKSERWGRFGKIVIPALIIAIIAGVAVGFESTSGPDTNVHVTSFEPSGPADRAGNITIKFSNKLVPIDSLDRPVLNPPLKINPLLPGIARWVEQDLLRFYPDGRLAPATEYKVSVASGESFLNGNRINEKRTFSFFTPGLNVTSSRYRTVPVRELPLHERIVVNFAFNYPVDLDQLQRLIEITGEENAEKRRLSFEVHAEKPRPQSGPAGFAASCNIVTEPLTLTDQTQTYRLRLKAGLECENCGAPLAHEFIRTLSVSPQKRLVIEQVYPEGAGTGFNIRVFLSTPIDADAARDFVTIDPDINFTLESAWGALIIRGAFQPGQTYTIKIAAGLPAVNGLLLEREFSTKIQVPNLPPSIQFTSGGLFLPRKGSGNIELQTVNVDKLAVEVEQIFENNLLHLLTGNLDYRDNLASVGRRIFFKEKELEYRLNEPLATTIDLSDIIGDTARGIFVVSARNKQNRWISDGRQVMMTDLGISARMAEDYLLVWVHSLSDTKPISKARVKLLSRNNQLLREGKTDSRGIAIFDHLAEYTEGFDPYLITVTRDDDLSYLRFSDCLLPTSDFDVSGRPYLFQGYEAYIYADRGIYRPGDTAHFVSVVRGVDASLPPEFPYVLVIRDPQDRLFQTLKVNTGKALLTALDYAIPDFSPTGRYTITARIGDDYQIGRTEFLVEEFMPDRIKVTISTVRDTFHTGDSLDIDVQAKFLFGPPARKHRVGGRITIERDLFHPAGWNEYTFSTDHRDYAKNEINLADTLLNNQGMHTYRHVLPDAIRPPSALKALLSAVVTEQGGRAVGAYRELTINPYDRYVGLRLKLDGYAKPGQLVETDVIVLNTRGKPVAAQKLKARFNRIIYNTVLKQDQRGRYRYVSEQTVQILDSTLFVASPDGAIIGFTPSDYGQYEIEVLDGTDGHAASTRFYASGWGYVPWSMESPEKIELDLDQTAYRPGATATVQIRAPFPGKLLLTVERDRVYDMITVDLAENTAEIELPVKGDYFPNSYITATLIRPAASVERHSPARAFGIAPLMLSTGDKKIPITISAPSVVRPRTPVKVNLETGTPGTAELTVAAVDAGILQLTDFMTPDPLDFFYGKKRPYLRSYDMYSFVYPEVERAQSHLSAAGGQKFAEARKRHLSPITARRVKPVALWSGVIRTDEDGRANITFDLPQFNGKLVIMAVGAREDRFGAASHDMIVRDRIVLQESFPRFTAPNDEVEGLVSVFNNTGQTADIQIDLDITGPATLLSEATQTLRLSNDAEGHVVFRLKADLRPGKIVCHLTAHSGADTSRIGFELPNRPAQPLKTVSGSGVVDQDRPATFIWPTDWLEGTGTYTLRTSSLAAVTFARNIQFLLEYPYGCLEQTVSRLFPLLYFNDLAKFIQPGIFGGGGPEYFVQEGIIKLRSMGLSDGSFSFWPGGTRKNHWATVYASHFLVEARTAGYAVDEDFYQRVLDNVRTIARGKNAGEFDTSQRIYAAYVLAKAGKLENKIVNYLMELHPGDLLPFSRYQMAGTLAMAGELEYARSLIPQQVQPDLFEPETGGDFNSGTRSDAILLDLLLNIDPQNPSVPALAQALINGSQTERWHSTQASAFALMALGKFFRDQAKPDFTGTIRISGGNEYPIDTSSFFLTRKDLAGKSVTISIDGTGPCFYFWQSSGVRSTHAADEFDRGLAARRYYLNESGGPFDINKVALGSRVICRITVEAKDKPLYNCVINDLIPAGLEIENPRIKTSPALSWIPRNERDPDYQDIRDDRLLLFVDLHPGKAFEYYYSLRAVSAGEFVVPPIAAECMYNPLIAGAASSGRMVITGDNAEKEQDKGSPK